MKRTEMEKIILPVRITSVFAAALAMAVVASTTARSHDFKAGSLELKHPWSAKAPAVAPVLGGYVTIVNTGTQGDRLIGGTTSVAERLEIHQSSIVDGVARMRPATQGIDIPAGRRPHHARQSAATPGRGGEVQGDARVRESRLCGGGIRSAEAEAFFGRGSFRSPEPVTHLGKTAAVAFGLAVKQFASRSHDAWPKDHEP